jgi:pimeloyl-ACP methyl ester carboxylesterase
MKSCILLLVGVIIGIITLFGIPKTVFANYDLNDNFSFLNNSVWNFINNNENIEIVDDNLRLSAASGYKFPFVTLKNKLDLGDKYIIDLRFKFSGNLSYGNGIVFSHITPSNNSSKELDSTNVIFQIWPKTSAIWGIWSPLCDSRVSFCVDNKKFEVPLSSTQATSNEWHEVKIIYENNTYKVNVDNTLVFSSLNTDLGITDIWFGNYEKLLTVNSWPNLYIDYLYVYDDVAENEPTIIIPGLGASWDLGAMLTGTDGNNWNIPSFINEYDGLKNSFIKAGYSETDDQNLFTFSYDWRKPLSVLAERLNSFIEDRVPSGKINIVGHSMGGLVARAYVDSYGDTRINKIVAVGSPNMGSVKAYGPWEGATVWDGAWWTKVALDITTHFGVLPGELPVDTVQRKVPSLKDLLPTYDFLVDSTNSTISSSSLIHKNDYLNSLNQSSALKGGKLTTITSQDIQTEKLLRVVAPSSEDVLNNLWTDGKPSETDPFVFVAGDGVVVNDSARGLFDNNVFGNGWHGELISQKRNIEKIFNVLGLDPKFAVDGTSDNRPNVFVAALKSPGELVVCDSDDNKCGDDLGLYFDEEKLFLLPDYNNQSLKIRIKEKGTGSYSLHLGNINDESNWIVAGGRLDRVGEVDFFDIYSDGHSLTAIQDTTPPSTPQISGFINPTLGCGASTQLHTITVDWTDSWDKNGVPGYEYNVNYPIGNLRKDWSTFFTTSQYKGSLNEGVHYIKVRTRDLAGNVSEWSNTCSITADWTPPSVTIESPSEGVYQSKSLPGLKYTVIDNLDESPVVTVTGWSKENGEHTVTVTATDKAENFNSASITYTIQNQKPKPDSDMCKKNGWRTFGLFRVFRFRNQGECVSYFNRMERLRIVTLNNLKRLGWRK